jgi:hypothetical protein
MCGRVYSREIRGASGIAAGFFTIVACNIAGCFFHLLKDIQILISGGIFGGFFFFLIRRYFLYVAQFSASNTYVQGR